MREQVPISYVSRVFCITHYRVTRYTQLYRLHRWHPGISLEFNFSQSFFLNSQEKSQKRAQFLLTVSPPPLTVSPPSLTVSSPNFISKLKLGVKLLSAHLRGEGRPKVIYPPIVVSVYHYSQKKLHKK